jgi:mRNA interferase MazF
MRWYAFKASDKQRPVLILSRDSIIPFLHELTIAPITSPIRDIPSEVILSRANGVPKDCAVNCDHLQTVPKNRIGKLVATLDKDTLTEVSTATEFALDL